MYAGKIIEEGRAEALFSPLHPYTNALVKTIPQKEKKGKKLDSIHGKVPSIYDNFTGCPFAPRCLKAQNVCSQIFPVEKTINSGKVFCHFPHTENTEETENTKRANEAEGAESAKKVEGEMKGGGY